MDRLTRYNVSYLGWTVAHISWRLDKSWSLSSPEFHLWLVSLAVCLDLFRLHSRTANTEKKSSLLTRTKRSVSVYLIFITFELCLTDGRLKIYFRYSTVTRTTFSRCINIYFSPPINVKASLLQNKTGPCLKSVCQMDSNGFSSPIWYCIQINTLHLIWSYYHFWLYFV